MVKIQSFLKVKSLNDIIERENRYKPKNNIKRIIYKCIKYRRNENIKKDLDEKGFSHTIQEILLFTKKNYIIE